MSDTKFDIKTEATRALYAYAGVNDLAVEKVRDYVSGVQKQVDDFQKKLLALDLTPEALRVQTRAAIDARVAELLEMSGKLQATANETYLDLAQRGETLVSRIRNQESTQDAVKGAKTTVAKAKAVRTQVVKAADAEAKAAKKVIEVETEIAKGEVKAVASAVKRTATRATSKRATAKRAQTIASKEAGAAKSSAKGAVTAARKTAEATVKAVAEAVEKVGD